MEDYTKSLQLNYRCVRRLTMCDYIEEQDLSCEYVNRDADLQQLSELPKDQKDYPNSGDILITENIETLCSGVCGHCLEPRREDPSF